MAFSLDTNVWMFGIFGTNQYCQKIIYNLASFQIVVPNQVRSELERNLTPVEMREFYHLVFESNVQFDLAPVPKLLITMFEGKGLKKGDAIIGAYCEWRNIDAIVSDNRDFLRGLSGEHSFEVLSPQEFCERFGL